MLLDGRASAGPDGGADIVQHLGGDRAEQQSPHHPAAARRHHHQIGALVLQDVVNDAARFTFLGQRLDAVPGEALGGELAQPLFFDTDGASSEILGSAYARSLYTKTFSMSRFTNTGRKANACTKVSSAEKCRVMSFTYGIMAVHDGE